MRKFVNWRIHFLAIIFFLIVGGIVSRLFLLQILQHDVYQNLAQGQHQLYQKLIPQRGQIFVQDKYSDDYFPVATNKQYQMVYAVPQEFQAIEKDLEEISGQLAEILELSKDEILAKLDKKNDPYEPLKHKLSDQEVEKIKELNLAGIYLAPESRRYYPSQNLTSHIVGFVGWSGDLRIGQYGLEGYYQDKLTGQTGFVETVKDAFGRLVWASSQKIEEAKDGADLILTIDRNIQFMAYQELEKLIEKWQAEGGSVIIMEPKTGAIRAMANLPDFDPNQYHQAEDISIFLDPCTQKTFEPGSVFKPITMAAGLDAGKVTPQTTYTDKGYVTVGGYTIRNAASRIFGQSSMTNVLEKSINTGVVFVEEKIGHQVFREYVEAFGFDRPTQIDLAGEAIGSISNLKYNRPANFATASFGQGVAVTPIELIVALGAIANEGKLMRPYLVERIIYPDDNKVETESEVIQQVITSKTASQLTSMLVSAAENGAIKVNVPEYFVAGKTGTAQISDPEKGGYLPDTNIHSYVGWAPAFDPKFIILLKLDKPQGVRWAATTLTPAFTLMTKFLLNYYEIPPER